MTISDGTEPGSIKNWKYRTAPGVLVQDRENFQNLGSDKNQPNFEKIESVRAIRPPDLIERGFLIHKTCKQLERVSLLWKLSRDGEYCFVKTWLWLNMGRLSCLVMSDLFIWKQMRTWMMICTRTSSIRNIFGDFKILRFFESFEYFFKNLTFIFLIRLKNTQIRLQIILC